ncbi:MAG: hypothetical protein BA861_07950 [Desulfobacterales bacterium S3730MH5]|nr:MAG: hypothetical protein BA861_07950 [Desulfobacterales bacterium S3730MH5]
MRIWDSKKEGFKIEGTERNFRLPIADFRIGALKRRKPELVMAKTGGHPTASMGVLTCVRFKDGLGDGY